MTLATLLKFNLRYYKKHSLLALLCLMGISLGVGIVIAVELINGSALASFSASIDFLSGKASHSVVSQYGRIDEKEFRSIWKHPMVSAASPIIDVMATTAETGSDSIRFLGIDPFLDPSFRGWTPQESDDTAFTSLLAGPIPSIYMSEELAQKHNLKPGAHLTLLKAGLEKKILLVGIIRASVSGNLSENLAVMDIASAQELFGRIGRLDRIDLVLRGDPETLRKALPDGLTLADANTRKATLNAMLYSFQLNLAAMSLIALFVGVFLIYNFSMFSVLSRREDMSLLLTLGSDTRGLVGAFITESLLLSAAGSLLGVVFGYLVAHFSISMVSSTISQLYYQVNVGGVHLTVPIVLSGVGVGLVATLIGVILPALEVAVTPPVLGIKRQSIEDRVSSLKKWLLALGTLFFIASVLGAWASRFSIFWGFAAAFGMTFAFALMTPASLSIFTHHLGSVLKRVIGSLIGFLAARNIKASLSRTSIAVAALAVALSMTIGVDTMIYSFRGSVASWLDGSLQGDIYISPDTTKWDHPLPDDLMMKLQADPRVASLEKYSTFDIYINDRLAKLRVLESELLKDKARFHFIEGSEDAWNELPKGSAFISESLSFKSGIRAGEKVRIPTPQGAVEFPVVAVTRDYSSDQGTVQIDRNIYKKLWGDDRVQSIALFLKPGVSTDEVKTSIMNDFRGLEKTVVSNSQMRETVLGIFDKTFAPTATLKGVSLLVGLLGVATAMMAILMERSRDIRVLGYLGLTSGELGRMNIYQGLIMGFSAFLIASVSGTVLTYIIVHAINYRSFGWSIDIRLNPWVFVETLSLTIAACFASSLYPTLKLMKIRTAPTLKEE